MGRAEKSGWEGRGQERRREVLGRRAIRKWERGLGKWKMKLAQGVERATLKLVVG